MKIVDAEGRQREIDVFFDKVSTGGRPRKILTDEALKLVEGLSKIMCTDEEIASLLGCSRDVFYTPDNKELYRQAIEKGQAQGKQSLRREQWKLALKGNCTMLVWLGKQWLGQTEKVQQMTDLNISDGVQVMHDYLEDIKNGTLKND